MPKKAMTGEQFEAEGEEMLFENDDDRCGTMVSKLVVIHRSENLTGTSFGAFIPPPQ